MKTLTKTPNGDWKMKLGTKLADMPVVGETVIAEGVERVVDGVQDFGGLTRFHLSGDTGIVWGRKW